MAQATTKMRDWTIKAAAGCGKRGLGALNATPRPACFSFARWDYLHRHTRSLRGTHTAHALVRRKHPASGDLDCLVVLAAPPARSEGCQAWNLCGPTEDSRCVQVLKRRPFSYGNVGPGWAQVTENLAASNPMMFPLSATDGQAAPCSAESCRTAFERIFESWVRKGKVQPCPRPRNAPRLSITVAASGHFVPHCLSFAPCNLDLDFMWLGSQKLPCSTRGTSRGPRLLSAANPSVVMHAMLARAS